MAFQLVFEVAVQHAYYAPETCAGLLRWSCPGDTLRRLQRGGCVMRPTAEGVAVYAETSRLPALQGLANDPDEPLDLLLLAQGLDHDFAAATAGPGRDRPLHLYDSTRTRAPRPDGWRRLYRAAGVQAASGPGAVAAPDAWTLLSRLPLAEQQRRPSLALRMRIEPGAGDTAAWAGRALARRWRLALHTRVAFWKYLLPAEWAAQQPRVVDLAGAVEFEPPALETLPDGRQALAVRSRSAIALQRRSPRQFQLQARAPRADPVLVRRLPVAAPGAYGRALIDGAPRLVSEIYVQR